MMTNVNKDVEKGIYVHMNVSINANQSSPVQHEIYRKIVRYRHSNKVLRNFPTDTENSVNLHKSFLGIEQLFKHQV